MKIKICETYYNLFTIDKKQTKTKRQKNNKIFFSIIILSQPIPINTFSDISFNFNKEEGLKEKIEELTKRTNPNTKKNY